MTPGEFFVRLYTAYAATHGRTLEQQLEADTGIEFAVWLEREQKAYNATLDGRQYKKGEFVEWAERCGEVS